MKSLTEIRNTEWCADLWAILINSVSGTMSLRHTWIYIQYTTVCKSTVWRTQRTGVVDLEVGIYSLKRKPSGTLLCVMQQPEWEGSLRENGYTYVYSRAALLFTWNYHNIVNQLYSNTKWKVFHFCFFFFSFLFFFLSEQIVLGDNRMVRRKQEWDSGDCPHRRTGQRKNKSLGNAEEQPAIKKKQTEKPWEGSCGVHCWFTNKYQLPALCLSITPPWWSLLASKEAKGWHNQYKDIPPTLLGTVRGK